MIARRLPDKGLPDTNIKCWAAVGSRRYMLPFAIDVKVY